MIRQTTASLQSSIFIDVRLSFYGLNAELVWTDCITSPAQCVCSDVWGPGLSGVLASTSISSDWNWGSADEIHSVKVFFHTHTHTCSQLQSNGYRPQLHQTDDEWQKAGEKMERKDAWERGRIKEEAVFQSHLANGCHWWILMLHHSPNHQLLRCVSTTADEINTGLLQACVCFLSACICRVVFLIGHRIKQYCYFRASSLGWVNIFRGDCTTESSATHPHWKMTWSFKRRFFCNSATAGLKSKPLSALRNRSSWKASEKLSSSPDCSVIQTGVVLCSPTAISPEWKRNWQIRPR